MSENQTMLFPQSGEEGQSLDERHLSNLPTLNDGFIKKPAQKAGFATGSPETIPQNNRGKRPNEISGSSPQRGLLAMKLYDEVDPIINEK
ncbi:MAG: hypothetical protein ACM3PY_16125 [Omnitrophica WOR_2 bacterium]